jgi:hypothetical protein
MKHLSLGLFVAYLLFISAKSFYYSVSAVELGVLACLFLLVVGEKIIKLIYKLNYKKHLIELQKIELQRPQEINEDIKKLQEENEIEALKLRKFMTQAEYHKREISRAVEKDIGAGGLRF